MKKTFIIVLFFFTSLLTFGQITDNFSDGDFINTPIWSGSASNFIINSSGFLQLSNTVAGTSILLTPFACDFSEDTEWQFFVKQTFAPSASNYGRVYLMSDQSDLTGPINGYYLQLGEAGSSDAVELFRQTGLSSIPVCRATEGAIASSFGIRIKIIRNTAGFWQLFIDYEGGNNYALEASGTDVTHSSTNFIGVSCTYTVSNAAKFFFDDFYAGDITVDTDLPVLQLIQVVSGTELLLTFDENLNSSSAQNLTNFIINNGIGNPESAILQSDQKSIKLTFSTPFPANLENELTISNIKDLADNVIPSTSQHFTYVTAVFNDVVINELYLDPSPQVGLPSQEFVEIYNRSNEMLNLAGWKLSDPTTIATLPNYQILPGDYIILTSSSGVAPYTSSGKVIGLSNFPSLNNDSDKIKLINADGLKIDSISYESSWYQNKDKTEGGWTIERLNPQVNTNEPTNWRASENLLGGTPGKQNAVFGKNPDIKVPELINLTIVSEKELLLEFNESLAANSTQQSLYFVNNTIGNPMSVSLSGESKFVQLQFETLFTNGVDYDLTLSGIQDMAGNTMPDLLKSFRYFLSVPSKFKDVIINEIMADPSPVVQLPEAEYIELFNRTDSPFDLKDWSLTDATATIKLNSAVVLPHDFIILTSTSNAYKFSNYGKVIGVSSFPSLNNGGEPIVLKNSFDELIDSVRYSLDWYKDDNRSDGGWSLEIIDPENSCGEGSNWISAEGETGGTPGKQNSVFANKPDLSGPKLITAIARPDQVLLTFNEKLEKNILLLSFRLSPEVSISNAVFTDLSLRQIQLVLNSTLATRTAYEVTIDLRDCSGNTIQEDFNHITFALPEPPDSLDILINEILFNPKPTGVDFVEIYNHSPKFINLKNYKLANFEEGQIKNE
ncbi:MAG TPA: lamin tail domain-containing protein, partial [Cyclobacteriaceae bacterium]